MSAPPIFVGIEVAKAQLDIALRPTGERGAGPNEDASIATLVTQLQAVCPVLIVLEATGGFQRAVVAALAAAVLPVVVVHPRQGRDCAKATGQLAKTDGLDARALAHCAEAVRPTPRPLPDAQTDALRALLARRRQRVAMRTAASNRLGSAPPRIQADLQAHIAWLAQRLAARDDDLDTTLRSSPVWRERETLSRSVPGLGPVCARTLVLDLPELGPLRCQCLAAGVGVAPLYRDRGPRPGAPHHLGRAHPCASHPGYEDIGRGAAPPSAQNFLRASVPRGQSQDSGPDRVHAQVVDHLERHGAALEAVASAGGAERITYQAPLTIQTVAMLYGEPVYASTAAPAFPSPLEPRQGSMLS